MLHFKSMTILNKKQLIKQFKPLTQKRKQKITAKN